MIPVYCCAPRGVIEACSGVYVTLPTLIFLALNWLNSCRKMKALKTICAVQASDLSCPGQAGGLDKCPAINTLYMARQSQIQHYV